MRSFACCCTWTIGRRFAGAPMVADRLLCGLVNAAFSIVEPILTHGLRPARFDIAPLSLRPPDPQTKSRPDAGGTGAAAGRSFKVNTSKLINALGPGKPKDSPMISTSDPFQVATALVRVLDMAALAIAADPMTPLRYIMFASEIRRVGPQ